MTSVRNFKKKKTKKDHEVDFLIDDLAAIEAKNWDCFSGKGYDVTTRDMRNQVFLKFGKYPGFKRILIIGKPNWNGGKEYSNS